MRRRLSLASLLLALAVAGLAPRTAAAAAPSAEVTVVSVATLPDDADDKAWQNAPAHAAPLVLQDVVEPRLLVPSTKAIDVQALSDGQRIAFRLSWGDVTKDDLPGTGRFSDACAVQLPARTEPDLPAPQMGEPGRPVELVYWRATWQATVDGRPDDIKEIHPGAAIDHYPFEAASLTPGSPEQLAMAKRYAPARALGNSMAGPRSQPVEDLVAEGPGSLSPAAKQDSRGRGRRGGPGWVVVLTRPLPGGFREKTRSQVAFAVWDGSQQEVGARKMRSLWIPIAWEEKR